jgi:L-ribulokinase
VGLVEGARAWYQARMAAETPMLSDALFLGLDFGTESVRAVLVDRRGELLASASESYPHGQIVLGSASAEALFAKALPPSMALQNPDDWLEAGLVAARGITGGNTELAGRIRGIGIDFTSCTTLPTLEDGLPLCRVPAHRADPHAWPKLWKHHGALEHAAAINRIAADRREPWLGRYGGAVGLEWLWPKVLEVVERSPAAAEAARVWVEAGDWLVWQLVGAPVNGGAVGAAELPRSTCQAGYKACWSADGGYPSIEFFRAVNPGLATAAPRGMTGRLVAPGRRAGGLCAPMASAMGVRQGTAVSAAMIDAHAGVPGAGAGSAGELVLVMGTSGCHMVMAEHERLIPGVAGVVRDGILPGLYGYETGQACMGDAFDLVRRLAGEADFATLDRAAAHTPPGADGLLCLDWFNGCRTPLMDGSLTGAFLGLGLHHTPAHIYRAALEGSALGLRWIVETLEAGDIPIHRVVATGGLPTHNPLLVRIAASALGRTIEVHAAPHGPALGAAIIGAIAAGSAQGGFDDAREAVECMAGRASVLPDARAVIPDAAWARAYERLYGVYRQAAEEMASPDSAMRRLSRLGWEDRP